jgi:predicted phage replisome organizer
MLIGRLFYWKGEHVSNQKKYFWLKMKEGFFTQKEIKKLRKVAGGDTYTIIYLKIQLLSIKNGGLIKYDKTEKDIAEQLALELDEELDNVKITLSYMQANNLIESINENEYLLSKVPELVGNETDAAERMRKMRENRNIVTPLLHDVTKCYTEIEIDKEKDIEKDIEKHMCHAGTCKSSKEIIYTSDFENAWSLYPDRKGTNSKVAAFKQWQARIKEGVKIDDLIIATKHYQLLLQNEGSIGTPFVMQAQRFYGAAKEYEGFINEKKRRYEPRNAKKSAREHAEEVSRECDRYFREAREKTSKAREAILRGEIIMGK